LDLFGLFLYPQLNALRWGCPVLQFAPQINVLQTCYLVLQLVQVHRNGDGDSVVHNDDGDNHDGDDDDVPSMDHFGLFLYPQMNSLLWGCLEPQLVPHMNVLRGCLVLQLVSHMNVLRGCLVFQLAQVHRDGSYGDC